MSKPPRPPLPDLTDADLAEIFGAPRELPPFPHKAHDLWRLGKALLDAMPYIERRWACACKDCQRTTAVRDYGHPTHVYWRRRWMDLQWYCYLCGKHKHFEGTFEMKPRDETRLLTGHKLITPPPPHD